MKSSTKRFVLALFYVLFGVWSMFTNGHGSMRVVIACVFIGFGFLFAFFGLQYRKSGR